MNLIIKTMSGKEFSLNVDDTLTIRQVKEKIQEKEGLAVDQIRFIFNGKSLQDEYSITDYGIVDNSCLSLVIALIGK
jgi:uncharacterized ubiquitin-like protein YukD